MTKPPMLSEDEGEKLRQRNAELAAAAARQREHSDDGHRLGMEQECQHVHGWQKYCEGNRRKTRTALGRAR